MKKLLIISNNVLSRNNNNGKTILSFIDGSKDLEVAQLYLSGEIPKVRGYSYFQISDKDVLKGMFNQAKRGRTYETIHLKNALSDEDDFSIKNKIGRNNFTLLARDILWHNRWCSSQLISWLDSFCPDAILFVAGDSLFAYSICEFIQNRFKSKLGVLVTDDYIMPREKESLLHLLRRKKILKHLKATLDQASSFYTICGLMKQTYKSVLGKDSMIVFNLVNDLHENSYVKQEKEIVLTYAGSFYYNRSGVLRKVAQAIFEYNKQSGVIPAKLLMYSNVEPSKEIKEEIVIDGASEYKGSLSQEQLKARLNTSDILVFVESFEPDQVEKVKYSFSTKVPEYMSVEKPILAIGPSDIGSMEYLKDISFCINSEQAINTGVLQLLTDTYLRQNLARRARQKFLENHDNDLLRTEFLNTLL